MERPALPFSIRPAIALVFDDPQSLPPQPLELVEVAGKQDRTEVRYVKPTARFRHDQCFVRQLPENALLVSWQGDLQQLEAAVEVQQRQHIRPIHIRPGNARLERLAGEDRP